MSSRKQSRDREQRPLIIVPLVVLCKAVLVEGGSSVSAHVWCLVVLWCGDHAAVDTQCPAPPRRRRRPAQFTMGGGCSSNKYFYSGHQIFLCLQLQSCSGSFSVEIDGNRGTDLQSCQCVQIALNIFIVGNNLDNKGVRDCSFSCNNLKYFLQCQVSVRTFVSSADIFCD